MGQGLAQVGGGPKVNRHFPSAFISPIAPSTYSQSVPAFLTLLRPTLSNTLLQPHHSNPRPTSVRPSAFPSSVIGLSLRTLNNFLCTPRSSAHTTVYTPQSRYPRQRRYSNRASERHRPTPTEPDVIPRVRALQVSQPSCSIRQLSILRKRHSTSYTHQAGARHTYSTRAGLFNWI
jgi:hypothetical protein